MSGIPGIPGIPEIPGIPGTLGIPRNLGNIRKFRKPKKDGMFLGEDFKYVKSSVVETCPQIGTQSKIDTTISH